MTDTTRRTIRGGAHALSQELFTDAVVARPLPPLPVDRLGLTMLSAWQRQVSRWLPHVAVGVLAGVLFWLSWLKYDGYQDGSQQWSVLLGVTTGAPLVLVLFRPIAAWWLSLAGICAVLVSGLDVEPFPFAETTFASHLTVMVLVALRSRPAVTAVMWLCTVGAGNVAVQLVEHDPWEGDNVSVFAVWSATALTGAVLVRGWLEARGRAAASHSTTLVERSKRTVLEERTTIARELHDVVAHHMSVIAIQAEAAPYRVESIQPEIAASFLTIRENAVAALDELRRVLGVIRVSDYATSDAPEAPQPTLDALDGLLDNVRGAGLPVDKVVTGARRELPQGVELSAYRIIQEALSNALRHSPGAATRVELAYVLGGLGVRIVNGPADADAAPGAGTEPGQTWGGSGHGITGMRERVAMLEGEMTAGPTPDGGYEIAVFLPAPPLAEQRATAEELA